MLVLCAGRRSSLRKRWQRYVAQFSERGLFVAGCPICVRYVCVCVIVSSILYPRLHLSAYVVVSAEVTQEEGLTRDFSSTTLLCCLPSMFIARKGGAEHRSDKVQSSTTASVYGTPKIESVAKTLPHNCLHLLPHPEGVAYTDKHAGS